MTLSLQTQARDTAVPGGNSESRENHTTDSLDSAAQSVYRPCGQPKKFGTDFTLISLSNVSTISPRPIPCGEDAEISHSSCG